LHLGKRGDMRINSTFCGLFCSVVVSSADHFVGGGEPYKASSIGANCSLVGRAESADQIACNKR
jgi:hypothetical protein